MPQAHTSDKHRRERNTAAVGNLPLSFCESQYTKLNPISVTTLTSLMEALTKAVETTIGEEMPDDFGLIIDGWTHAPVMDEPDDHLNADGHMMAISNKRIANLLRVPLIGCASHRLNLAVREYLEPYDSNLETKTPLAPVLRQDTRCVRKLFGT
ncbi:hypothetical protein PC129_g13623 [Phytophthora cactorum]|uniref:Uncharacterized protein n=1 Tax=Phytophthora cactorum TaxID=29920 RepID=A0A8T1HWR2_9STRA|nr:hypothetical protein PC122_g14823 [Phytophthora cactorum]KAG3148588.1 hypothetical protein C6341_g17356 [Phytophthora cactorum]KAG3215482.1 hypothetical protein PC129_g13623 [Phytophthora cactorum]